MTLEQARQHPGVLAGTHRVNKASNRPGGWRPYNIAKQRAAANKYDSNHREKNREKECRRWVKVKNDPDALARAYFRTREHYANNPGFRQIIKDRTFIRRAQGAA